MKDFKTEAEAKKLWCPCVRVSQGANRNMDKESHLVCVASSCMFWRWSHQDTGALDPPTGFCGAAGLPKYI